MNTDSHEAVHLLPLPEAGAGARRSPHTRATGAGRHHCRYNTVSPPAAVGPNITGNILHFPRRKVHLSDIMTVVYIYIYMALAGALQHRRATNCTKRRRKLKRLRMRGYIKKARSILSSSHWLHSPSSRKPAYC